MCFPHQTLLLGGDLRSYTQIFSLGEAASSTIAFTEWLAREYHTAFCGRNQLCTLIRRVMCDHALSNGMIGRWQPV